MENFKFYLKSVANIPDKYIPFYIHWVKAAYNFFKLNLNIELSQNQTKTLLQKLSLNPPYWQIKQAQAALRHYQFFYKNISEWRIQKLPPQPSYGVKPSS